MSLGETMCKGCFKKQGRFRIILFVKMIALLTGMCDRNLPNTALQICCCGA